MLRHLALYALMPMASTSARDCARAAHGVSGQRGDGSGWQRPAARAAAGGAYLDAEHFVPLELDGHAVRVPAEVARHVEAGLVGEARPHVLDRARQDVAVVRRARRERRAIVEAVLRLALRLAQLVLEGVHFVPELHGLLLELGEGGAGGHCENAAAA